MNFLFESLYNSTHQNSWQKRRGGEIAQGKAKDAGGLTPANDDTQPCVIATHELLPGILMIAIGQDI